MAKAGLEGGAPLPHPTPTQTHLNNLEIRFYITMLHRGLKTYNIVMKINFFIIVFEI